MVGYEKGQYLTEYLEKKDNLMVILQGKVIVMVPPKKEQQAQKRYKGLSKEEKKEMKKHI